MHLQAFLRNQERSAAKQKERKRNNNLNAIRLVYSDLLVLHRILARNLGKNKDANESRSAHENFDQL